MSGGGSSQPTQQNVTSTTSNLPAYAQPYFENLMNRAQAQSYEQYTPYKGEQVAGFNPSQYQTMGETMGLQTPGQYAGATQLAGAAGLGSLAAGQYDPGRFHAQQIGQPNLQNYQMQGPQDVQAQQQGGAQMGAAKTDYNPNLNYFQMSGPQAFGNEQAQQYMSPYFQNVLDVQKREAATDAQKSQLMQNLGAARQGTYGGARQLLAGTERERALGQQMGDIQAKGTQAAYENAQSQFERDRASRMQVGSQNLQAALQTQQLGAQTGLQTALANLSSEQQANVQNLAAQLQTQGLNADQALKAAMANQQTGLQTGQQNLAAQLQTQQLGTQSGLQALMANQSTNMQGQQMGEQSRQFGANLGLQGLSQAGQMAQTLSGIGTQQQQADLARLNAQGAVGAQQQQLQQQYDTTAYNNFLAQRDWNTSQLGYYSNMLRGLPVTPNTTTSTPAPSALAQLGGAGLGAASVYNLAKG